MPSNDKPLTAIALVCTLNPSPKPSSSQLLAEQVLTALGREGVEGEAIRIVDHDVRPGVGLDMGDGDAWPALRERVMAADILVLATPSGSATHPASPSASWNASTPSCRSPTMRAGS